MFGFPLPYCMEGVIGCSSEVWMPMCCLVTSAGRPPAQTPTLNPFFPEFVFSVIMAALGLSDCSPSVLG